MKKKMITFDANAEMGYDMNNSSAMTSFSSPLEIVLHKRRSLIGFSNRHI